MVITGITSKAQALANDISAFKSKEFGSKYWYVLFTMVLGVYPNKLDKNNSHHIKLRKIFKYLLYNLKYTLPCSICRMSYSKFYSELDINKYLDSKIRLAYWLYLLKDKVNNKLIKQERIIKKLSDKTKPSPSFYSVIKCYYSLKANTCSKKTQRCS